MKNPANLKSIIFRQLNTFPIKQHQSVFINDDFMDYMLYLLTCIGNSNDQHSAIEILLKIFTYDENLVQKWIDKGLLTKFVNFLKNRSIFDMSSMEFYKFNDLTQIIVKNSPQLINELMKIDIVNKTLALSQRTPLGAPYSRILTAIEFFKNFFIFTPSTEVLYHLLKIIEVALKDDSKSSKMEVILWLKSLPLSDIDYSLMVIKSKCFKQLKKLSRTSYEKKIRKNCLKIVNKLRYNVLLFLAYKQ